MASKSAVNQRFHFFASIERKFRGTSKQRLGEMPVAACAPEGRIDD